MKLKSLVSIDPLMSEKPLLSEQLFLAGPVYLREGKVYYYLGSKLIGFKDNYNLKFFKHTPGSLIW